jgi:large subunit ribosomal protein L25
MENIVLEAKERKVIDKKNRNALRKEDRVTGVLYSKRIEPISIDVARKSLNPLVFTTKAHIISLKVDGHDDHECVIKDIQFDPVTDKIVHFDLLGLTRGEKFQLEVPIKFIGNAIGVKEGGILQEILHKINIECLPVNIPQSLEIDISNLKVGTSIHVKDLNFENIEILNPADAIVVTVSVPKVEKEAVSVEEGAEAGATGATGAAEPEVIGKGKESKDETD